MPRTTGRSADWLAGVLVVGLWLLVGASWWAAVAAVVAALVTWSLGRWRPEWLPRLSRRPVLAGAAVGVVALAPVLSWGQWLLTAAGVLAVTIIAAGDTVRRRDRGRAVLGTAVVVTVVLASAGVVELVVESIRAQHQRQADWERAAEYDRARLLPGSPTQAGDLVLLAVATDNPGVCDAVFAPDAATQFAAAAGETRCDDAVRLLAGRVNDRARYQAPDRHSIVLTLDSQSGSADLCHLAWNGTRASPPGPQLGRLDLTRRLGQGYLVTRFSPC